MTSAIIRRLRDIKIACLREKALGGHSIGARGDFLGATKPANNFWTVSLEIVKILEF